MIKSHSWQVGDAQNGKLLYCRVAPRGLKELRPLSGSKPGRLELEAGHLVLKLSGA